MAVYAACVYSMDRAVGELVAGLKKRGEYENTMIMFMSDNGGNAEGGVDGNTNGDPTEAKSNWHCGQSWAYMQNTPFRLYKHYNHEGGIASPLIVHWPAGIKAKGEWRNQATHVIDIMPTCIEITGASYPEKFKGQSILPLEGKSLVPAFANRPIERDALYWEHEGNAAVREGDLKLVRQKRTGDWELFDLNTDRTEQHNLAANNPAKVSELAAQWEAWALRAHAEPSPQSRGGGKKQKSDSKEETE